MQTRGADGEVYKHQQEEYCSLAGGDEVGEVAGPKSKSKKLKAQDVDTCGLAG